MESSRFFLTIIVCFLVAAVYMSVVPGFRAPTPEQTTSQEGTPGPGTDGTGTVGNGNSSGSVPNGSTPTGEPATAVPSPDASSANTGVIEPAPNLPVFERKTWVLENPLLRIELDSRGAGITHVAFLEYFEDDRVSPLPLLSPELLSGTALSVDLPGVQGTPQTANWELLETPTATEAQFRLPLGDGRSVTKTLRLDEDEYLLQVELSFAGEWPATQPLHYTLLGPDRVRFEGSGYQANTQIIAYANDRWQLAEVARESLRVVPNGEKTWGMAQRILWSGIESNYFAFALRPLRDDTPKAQLVLRADSDESAEDRIGEYNQQGIQGLRSQVGFRAPIDAQGTRHVYEVFLGPKERTLLGSYEEEGYNELIYYGTWLGPLVRLFLVLLSFFHGLVGSYGIAIVFLTVIVKLVLHPINKKNQGIMMRQQKKMSKIQPQMKEIKERHKNDALKANREIQKLMKEHDVNPAQMFGGCLLMFLQLPIWIGLITTFRLALELRHTSFLYIDDLTQPDMLFQLPFSLPFLGEWFNLLPVLYVIVTIISQKMMPKATDPQMAQQQKMMMWMMVAFGFIFYSFSSGLLLYFLTSASLGIVEQKIIRRELEKEGLGGPQTASSASPKS